MFALSIACTEAYASDIGAAYACSVGCGVSVDSVISSELAQISVINNLMDVLFVSRVLDMLSYDDEAQVDISDQWGSEVDVYVSEVSGIIGTLACDTGVCSNTEGVYVDETKVLVKLL